MTRETRIGFVVGLLFVVMFGLVLTELTEGPDPPQLAAIEEEARNKTREVATPVVKGQVEISENQVTLDGAVDQSGVQKLLTAYLEAQRRVVQIEQELGAYRLAAWTMGGLLLLVGILACAYLHPQLRIQLRLNRGFRLELTGLRDEFRRMTANARREQEQGLPREDNQACR